MKGDGKLLITEATFGFACFVSVLVITVIIVTNRWYMGSYFFTQNVAKYTPHITCRATTMYCPIPVVIHYAVWVVFYSFLRSMTLLFCRIGIQSLTPSQLKMIWKATTSWSPWANDGPMTNEKSLPWSSVRTRARILLILVGNATNWTNPACTTKSSNGWWIRSLGLMSYGQSIFGQ